MSPLIPPSTRYVRRVERLLRRRSDPQRQIRQELLRYIMETHRQRAMQRARGLGGSANLFDV